MGLGLSLLHILGGSVLGLRGLQGPSLCQACSRQEQVFQDEEAKEVSGGLFRFAQRGSKSPTVISSLEGDI